MNRPHWLFVDAAHAFGGHEVMLLSWLSELQDQGRITPVLLARDASRLHRQARERVETLSLTSSHDANGRRVGSLRSLWRGMKDAWRILQAIRRYQPRLCVVAEGSLLSQAGYTLLLRLFGQHTLVYVPLVEPATGMGFGRGPERDWLMRHVYRHIPHGWITITREQAEQFTQWAQLTTPVWLLPNTVAREIEAAPRITHVVHHPLRVLVLGRLDAHQKGLDDLLKFLAQHPELHEQLHISLVGEGPYRAEIERQLQDDPALRSVVSVRPWAPTLQVLREHDVLLLCSRYEGMPLVMLEAMAMGLPMVASDLPGTRAMLSADCLFAVGDMARAFHLLFVVSGARRDTFALRNLEVFNERASSAAFAVGVAQLTEQLLHLDESAATAQFSDVSPKVDFP